MFNFRFMATMDDGTTVESCHWYYSVGISANRAAGQVTCRHSSESRTRRVCWLLDVLHWLWPITDDLESWDYFSSWISIVQNLSIGASSLGFLRPSLKVFRFSLRAVANCQLKSICKESSPESVLSLPAKTSYQEDEKKSAFATHLFPGKIFERSCMLQEMHPFTSAPWHISGYTSSP